MERLKRGAVAGDEAVARKIKKNDQLAFVQLRATAEYL